MKDNLYIRHEIKGMSDFVISLMETDKGKIYIQALSYVRDGAGNLNGSLSFSFPSMPLDSYERLVRDMDNFITEVKLKNESAA